ncbi:ribosome small subunit-dependent GTPase A [Calycomorphotria hydatis]|uniref:ribosome small subunit-dependent GTPase A n=1 Tax=Calycomorphotria hydatis TaxID=2528027 RepID=UPI001E351F19|nr:ribosome small subunit-dependent GTPase A [Calycomorphotria hydatis]
MAKKRRKVRVEFRKNRGKRTRQNDLTREHSGNPDDIDQLSHQERISGKGDLTRHRTLIVDEDSDGITRDVDLSECVAGRVITAVGLNSLVQLESGERIECTVRRVLRTMAREARNAVVTGDHVWVRLIPPDQGVIERVEPRSGVLSRQHSNREHMIAANVDQAAIVASTQNPDLKLPLIDRFIASCTIGGVQPLIVINKCDLVETDDLLDEVGIYTQLAYPVILTSTVTGQGKERLARMLDGKTTVFSGQSGVGKSSLLNMVHADYGLDTRAVSDWSSKGTHTTRKATMLPLPTGGWVIDTPGVRQFELWDIEAGEVETFFVEFHPYIPSCRFPDCSHTHEVDCAVKQAVEEEMIAERRYESYVRMLEGRE